MSQLGTFGDILTAHAAANVYKIKIHCITTEETESEETESTRTFNVSAHYTHIEPNVKPPSHRNVFLVYIHPLQWHSIYLESELKNADMSFGLCTVIM